MNNTSPSSELPLRYAMPFTRIEIAPLGLVDSQLQVLLARRDEDPFRGRWALPGGVIRIDREQNLIDGARRIAAEQLGVTPPFLTPLCTVGGKNRDPGAPWALSVVYRALVKPGSFNPKRGKQVAELAWRPVDDAAADKRLAFDHAELIASAASLTRAEVGRLELPFKGLPPTFTLRELQRWCEELLGHGLDKSSFRRKLDARGLVELAGDEMRGGTHRPAQVFRARHETATN